MAQTPVPNKQSAVKNSIPDGDKYITLFADASFCPQTKAYGWCYWIKHGTPSTTVIKSGGGFRIRSSLEAEIEALRQGIREIYSMGKIKGKRIVVQSDCLGALFKIGKELEALKGVGAASAYTKHVRGHQGHKDARSSVNTQCDKLAGIEMREFRKEKKQRMKRSAETRPSY